MKYGFLSLGMLSLAVTACTSSSQKSASENEEKKTKPNVLFIAVDDLRTELGCYGKEYINSPNIDELASEGYQFNRTYCQVPVSGASRASLLTGLRPTQDRFVNYYTWAEKDAPNTTPLSGHFKQNGYYCVSNGKVFHHRSDHAESWSETPWQAHGNTWRNYQLKKNIAAESRENSRGPAYECADVPDNAYFDGKIANKTISDLHRLKKREEPFFLAAGFRKPHLPFNAPKKYWDMYKRKNIEFPDYMKKPKNAPEEAMHNWAELRTYGGEIPDTGSLNDSLAKTLIHGYYACVSYIDNQIGKILDEVQQLGLEKNTIIVLWGDHGWHLREHGLWCKHCNFEKVLNAPLIIKVPGMKKDVETDALTEFVDIYPSLCDLCHIPKPDHLQGKSFVPVLKNPDQKWKEAVYSRYYGGVTVKTDRYCYTEFQDSTGTSRANMLYDHQNDYAETIDISNKPDKENVVKRMSKLLEKGLLKADSSKTR